MPNPCYYHPAASAVGTCIQCGTPGCADCLESVSGKMACRRCSAALKGKMATASGTPSVRPAAVNPNAGLNFASSPRDYVDTTPALPLTADLMLKGIALASVVGVLGAIGIEKILFYSNFGFALLYVLLGAAVSVSLRAFTGRGGQAMALTALGILIVCLGISHVVYVQDVMSRAQAAGDLEASTTFAQVFPEVMGSFKFVHWIFVLGSLIVCVTTANRE